MFSLFTEDRFRQRTKFRLRLEFFEIRIKAGKILKRIYRNYLISGYEIINNSLIGFFLIKFYIDAIPYDSITRNSMPLFPEH